MYELEVREMPSKKRADLQIKPTLHLFRRSPPIAASSYGSTTGNNEFAPATEYKSIQFVKERIDDNAVFCESQFLADVSLQ